MKPGARVMGLALEAEMKARHSEVTASQWSERPGDSRRVKDDQRPSTPARRLCVS